MIRWAVLAALCAFGTAAMAQGTAAPAAAASKIGVINVRQAIGNTSEGKLASAELQSKYAPRQNELETLNKQVNELQQRLAAGERTLSDEEKARLRQQGQRLAQQLERKQNELQEDANADQGDVIQRIGRKMMDVLDRYARENGYVAIFVNDPSSQTNPLLYSAAQIDITADIVRLYDQAYPVKSGSAAPAAAPKPAAPKPAAQKPPQQ
ncbi:MAG: OmpH family outer membrane protein [Acidobacteriia bacterium]|nr:OmpH family outer membrane protein [Terriglobia bacterium]